MLAARSRPPPEEIEELHNRIANAVIEGDLQVAVQKLNSLRDKLQLNSNQVMSRLGPKGPIGRRVRRRIGELRQEGNEAAATALNVRFLSITPLPDSFTRSDRAEQQLRKQIRGSRQ